jgi:hypothetical protein
MDSLTRTMNLKYRDDRMAEEINCPFYVPGPHEALGQQAYFCALRLAILQLDLTRRSMLIEAKFDAEVGNAHTRPEELMRVHARDSSDVDV